MRRYRNGLTSSAATYTKHSGGNYCKSVGLLTGVPSGEWRRERAAGISTIEEAGSSGFVSTKSAGQNYFW